MTKSKVKVRKGIHIRQAAPRKGAPGTSYQDVPEPVEVDPRKEGFMAGVLSGLKDRIQPGSRYFRMGQCTIILSREPVGNDWHMSISGQGRYPTWDEVAKARYALIPDDVTMAMLLPSRHDYINLNDDVFQLRQVSELRTGFIMADAIGPEPQPVEEPLDVAGSAAMQIFHRAHEGR